MTADVLTQRALNRATLERQLLLTRCAMEPYDAVGYLVGLQSQVPLNPYVALWSRLDAFDPVALGQLMTDRRLVRIVVMRGTIHLVTDDDALALRPLFQPVLDMELERHAEHAPFLRGADLTPVLEFAKPLLAETPMNGTKLRAAIAERFPDLNAAAFAYACRNHLALVQIPPRGVWGRTLQVTNTPVDAWLGRPLVEHPSLDEMVLRYLAAFGPATPADATNWSRLTGLREVFDRLAPRLRAFTDEKGRELFDLPDAPRPDPDTPAPVRILPEYDNVLLSHADRTRFTTDDAPYRMFQTAEPVHGTVLVDGLVQATWRIDKDKVSGSATLVLTHTERWTKRTSDAVLAEGRRFVEFYEPSAASHDTRVVALD